MASFNLLFLVGIIGQGILTPVLPMGIESAGRMDKMRRRMEGGYNPEFGDGFPSININGKVPELKAPVRAIEGGFGVDDGLKVYYEGDRRPDIISKENGFIPVEAEEIPLPKRRPDVTPFFMKNPFWPFRTHIWDSCCFEERQPWWKGPNVCVDRSETNEGDQLVINGTSSLQESVITSSFGSGSLSMSTNMNFNNGELEMTSCNEEEDKYSCVTRIKKFGISKTIKVTYRCCHGFVRDDAGCTKVDLRSLPETLEKVGATDFLGLAQSAEFSRLLQSENLTIFAPSNEAFQEFRADIEEKNDIYGGFDGKSSSIDGESLFKVHVIPGIFHASHLIENETLNTLEGSTVRINSYYGYPRVLTVNCARVTSSNQLATNGVVHSIDRILAPVKKNVLEILAEDPQFSTFYKMLKKSGVDKEFSEEDELTLFAPTDSSLSALEEALLQELLEGGACLEAVMRNHIAANMICSTSVNSKAKATNLLDEHLVIQKGLDDKLLVDDAEVVARDVVASNGVIHAIDKLLMPDQARPIVELLQQHNLTNFLELLELAEMTKEVSDMKSGTIFVPSNAAIDAASLDKDDKSALKNLLRFHIVDTAMHVKDFVNNQRIETLTGEPMKINLFTSRPFMMGFSGLRDPWRVLHMTAGCSRVTSVDRKACGVTVHVIDDVLRVPKQSVMHELASNPDYSILSEMLKTSNVSSLLKEDGSFTLFAPSDHVFKTLPEKERKLILEDESVKEKFLLRHILSEQICCSTVNPNSLMFTDYNRALDGSALYVRKTYSGLLMVDRARITDCGVPTRNGVVHRINSLLYDTQEMNPERKRGRRFHVFSDPRLDLLFGF